MGEALRGRAIDSCALRELRQCLARMQGVERFQNAESFFDRPDHHRVIMLVFVQSPTCLSSGCDGIADTTLTSIFYSVFLKSEETFLTSPQSKAAGSADQEDAALRHLLWRC
jgi:hypothetical protein